MHKKIAAGMGFKPFALLCLALVTLMQVVAADAREFGDGFRFVQITDTHLGQSGNLESLARVVERINGLAPPVACVVHTGDVFEDGILDSEVREKGLSILERLDPPLYVVPGNHDIRPGKLKRSRRVWIDAFSGLTYTKQVSGVRFLLNYTWPLAESFHMPGYDSLARLRSELEEAGDRPVIVAHHAPCLPELIDGALRGGWSKSKRREWIRLLSRHNVVAVLAGHFHRAELHWLGEVPLFVAPAVASSSGKSAIRVYNYQDGNLSYRTIRISDSGSAD
jgi:3',5'-cyclic AMP phosphodiesterase CpdA